jgi:hypothetical protein
MGPVEKRTEAAVFLQLFFRRPFFNTGKVQSIDALTLWAVVFGSRLHSDPQNHGWCEGGLRAFGWWGGVLRAAPTGVPLGEPLWEGAWGRYPLVARSCW